MMVKTTTSSYAGLLAYMISLSFLTSVLCDCPDGLGRTQSFSAHEDDDLLFMSPNLIHDVVNGRCVQTVYVTAGNNNQGEDYWGGREEGEQAAYAAMLGVSNSWTLTDAGISGHPMPLFTLDDAPQVSLVFMRLPDGELGGQGGSNFNFESLTKLWDGDIDVMHTVDSSSSYTKDDLLNTLLQLMTRFQPDQINVQDYVGLPGDHPDHYASATFAYTAHQSYTTYHTLTGYQGYGIADQPVNVDDQDTATKGQIYLVYAQFDPDTCSTEQDCANSVAAWWSRQYIVGQEVRGSTPAPTTPAPTTPPSATPAPTTPAPTTPAPTIPAPTTAAPGTPAPTTSVPTTVAPTTPVPIGNVARLATATASSQNTATQQTADKAIDGVIDGYPGDFTKEWATVGGVAGSWLKLTWCSPVTLRFIVLYDRPNLDDRVTAGTLTFSDGTKISVGALNNAGAAYNITLSPVRTTTSLLFTITKVASSTINIGLAEIQTFA